ncbi:MAG: crossover junction endodeoxyribonuclease RuvC [Candidatus Harrisonbacteria bacterium]|nr:crossover junction endodeoxyribonuclease RuvC [Candidatus Harrisonbacteria bacterium]MBI2603932.1 crossover junction endodeoxyribonuclease RuvC [Candidatus Harrisonbacteria bacterium]MBI3114725.1 crossover junction endodeoxyribonuclease RuvC [Candidatus Harrisonbacteria bacterium]
MKILGIDPGSARVGYGLIADDGHNLAAITHGVIELRQKDPHEKLRALGSAIRALLKKTAPDVVALERIYFSTNQKTGIAVAESRGAIALLVLEAGIPLLEYGPREVKQAVTNNGLADKIAVATMVKKILGLSAIEGPDDVSDALAIAITGAHRYKFDMRTKK